MIRKGNWKTKETRITPRYAIVLLGRLLQMKTEDTRLSFFSGGPHP